MTADGYRYLLHQRCTVWKNPSERGGSEPPPETNPAEPLISPEPLAHRYFRSISVIQSETCSAENAMQL